MILLPALMVSECARNSLCASTLPRWAWIALGVFYGAILVDVVRRAIADAIRARRKRRKGANP